MRVLVTGGTGFVGCHSVRALEGCDSVLHAANVYKFDARAAREMLEVNPGSTEHLPLALAGRAAESPAESAPRDSVGR